MQHTLDEQRAMRAVRSRFVCAVHYAYLTPDYLCMALEWLAGGTLAFHLKRRRAEVRKRERLTPFDESETRYYLASCALGLEAMHACGVVYRDLKPENVLLDKRGHPKLTDLGLAMLLGPADAAHSKAGTRGWWAPEVIRRQVATQQCRLKPAG